MVQLTPTNIRMWSIHNGFLCGEVNNWVKFGRRELNLGTKTIRTSKIKRYSHPYVETVGGGYYLLDGPSREGLVKLARTPKQHTRAYR